MEMEDGKSSIWIAIVITFLIMLILGGTGYYLLDKKNREDKLALESQVASLTQQIDALTVAKEETSNKEIASTGSVATESPWMYKNTTYGFSLTFNSKWEGFKLKLADIAGSTATYYVCVPTTDSKWSGTEAYPGTASVFAVSVYTKSQWATITAEEPVMTTKLGESSKYVFGYSQAQSAPNDIQSKGLFSDVKNVVATFSVL